MKLDIPLSINKLLDSNKKRLLPGIIMNKSLGRFLLSSLERSFQGPHFKTWVAAPQQQINSSCKGTGSSDPDLMFAVKQNKTLLQQVNTQSCLFLLCLTPEKLQKNPDKSPHSQQLSYPVIRGPVQYLMSEGAVEVDTCYYCMRESIFQFLPQKYTMMNWTISSILP